MAGCNEFGWTRYEGRLGLEPVGVWQDNYGGETTITSAFWGRSRVIDYNNEDLWAVIQSPADDEYTPNQYSKVVWTDLDASGTWATCTVALGSQASATNNRSFGFNENPRTAFDVAANRKAPEMTMSATPKPASLPLITSRSTAAPNNEKSRGWATLDHKSPKTAPAALYKGPVRNASASAASAAAPENPSAFSEKVSASATSIKAEAARKGEGRRSTTNRRSTSDPSHAPNNPATCVEIKLQAPHAIVALLSDFHTASDDLDGRAHRRGPGRRREHALARRRRYREGQADPETC